MRWSLFPYSRGRLYARFAPHPLSWPSRARGHLSPARARLCTRSASIDPIGTSARRWPGTRPGIACARHLFSFHLYYFYDTRAINSKYSCRAACRVSRPTHMSHEACTRQSVTTRPRRTAAPAHRWTRKRGGNKRVACHAPRPSRSDRATARRGHALRRSRHTTSRARVVALASLRHD